MASRVSIVKKLELPDHYYLTEQDQCYYFGEYTARKGYRFSETNQLIYNFKKDVVHRGAPQWHYKLQAIQVVARKLYEMLKAADRNVTFVPIPPSAAKGSPKYDDRLLQALTAARALLGRLDIRELVLQRDSMDPAHISASRLPPNELAENYEVVTDLLQPEPEVICIFDDVLTTGAHFKAMEQVIRAHLPNVEIFGLFVARRVPDSDLSDFDF